MCSSEMRPVFRAMSFVPAQVTTIRVCSSTTSARKRTSICEVVWPLMARLT